MNFEYKIKTSSRTKRIRISIFPDGRVEISKPLWVSNISAQKYVKSKSSWIIKKIFLQKSRTRILPELIHKDEVLEFVGARIQLYNKHYNFQIEKITIKDNKSLWGSCSAKKNLNFNKRIVSLPIYQADYIIVHELCHLKEFNHSQRFWTLVHETIPDYKNIRKELKNYSLY